MTDPDIRNRFAPPVATVADVATAGGLVLAGRGQRLAASMIDSLAMFVFAVAALMSSVFVGLRATGGNRTPTPDDVWGVVLAFVVAFGAFLVLQAWLLHTSGQTLGKRLLQIRIVRTDGSRVSFPRVFFGRLGFVVVLELVPFVGTLLGLVDTLLIFRDSRQCLHDQLFDTHVVSADSSTHATLAGERARQAAAAAA